MSSHQEPSGAFIEGAELNNETGDSGGNSGSRASRVKGQISEFAQTAKTQASAAIQPIAKSARSMAEEQKSRGATRIGDIAVALHGAADEIADEVPFAAGYVHTAATKLDETATVLRERSVDDLAKMAVEFAEERPLLYIGSAIAMGFFAARLLRSSVGADDEYEAAE